MILNALKNQKKSINPTIRGCYTLLFILTFFSFYCHGQNEYNTLNFKIKKKDVGKIEFRAPKTKEHRTKTDMTSVVDSMWYVGDTLYVIYLQKALVEEVYVHHDGNLNYFGLGSALFVPQEKQHIQHLSVPKRPEHICLYNGNHIFNFKRTSSQEYQLTEYHQIQRKSGRPKKHLQLLSTHGNSFVKYHFYGDSTYTLEWGNENVNNTSREKFEILGSGVPPLVDYDEKTIILGQSCGTSCKYYVILPLVPNSVEKIYMFAEAFNLEKKMVAYIPEEEDLFIRVENYVTGQYLDIKEENICPAAFKGECIDSVYFSDDTIVIKWQGTEWMNDRPDPKEKKIKIQLDN